MMEWPHECCFHLNFCSNQVKQMISDDNRRQIFTTTVTHYLLYYCKFNKKQKDSNNIWEQVMKDFRYKCYHSSRSGTTGLATKKHVSSIFNETKKMKLFSKWTYMLCTWRSLEKSFGKKPLRPWLSRPLIMQKLKAIT